MVDKEALEKAAAPAWDVYGGDPHVCVEVCRLVVEKYLAVMRSRGFQLTPIPISQITANKPRNNSND